MDSLYKARVSYENGAALLSRGLLEPGMRIQSQEHERKDLNTKTHLARCLRHDVAMRS